MKQYNSPLQFLSYNQHEQNSPVLLADNISITNLELLTEVTNIASWLQQNRVQPKQRVACFFDNNIDFFKVMLGIWAAGAIVVPINISILQTQRQAIIDKLEPHVFLSAKKELIDIEYTEGCQLELPKSLPIAKQSFIFHEPLPEDCAIIMFTSGTTGTPKGVMNSHFALAENCRLTGEALNINSKDRIFINTPAYYTSAICHFLTMLSQDASLFSHQGFMFSQTFFDLAIKYECTGFGGAPSHFNRIFAGITAKIHKPKKFRFMMSSGDHLPIHLIDKALLAIPDLNIYTVYGLSEVAGRLFILPSKDLPRKKGSVGKPFACMTVKILDENHKETQIDKLGEIYIQGPLLTVEYFRDPINTKELNTPFGFHTGDLGYFDSEGFLFLLGRNDDIFKSGGEKISTLMIQNTISQFEEFYDVAVIPIDDDIMMKVPVLFYVLKEGNSLDKKSCIKKLKSTLPANHIPSRFIEVNKIPRTGSGKVSRIPLIKLLQS